LLGRRREELALRGVVGEPVSFVEDEEPDGLMPLKVPVDPCFGLGLNTVDAVPVGVAVRYVLRRKFELAGLTLEIFRRRDVDAPPAVRRAPRPGEIVRDEVELVSKVTGSSLPGMSGDGRTNNQRRKPESARDSRPNIRLADARVRRVNDALFSGSQQGQQVLIRLFLMRPQPFDRQRRSAS